MSEVTTASGLIFEDVSVGSGETASAGMQVTVHYTGWLTDGAKFDSSNDRDDPFSFPLGVLPATGLQEQCLNGMQAVGVF